jgi:hypothetical protein
VARETTGDKERGGLCPYPRPPNPGDNKTQPPFSYIFLLSPCAFLKGSMGCEKKQQLKFISTLESKAKKEKLKLIRIIEENKLI